MGACHCNTVNLNDVHTVSTVAAAGKVSGQDGYLTDMFGQWKKCLANPQKLLDTAASKRSPFKFDRGNSQGKVQMDLGVCAVSLPDSATDFGRRFIAMIDKIQDLWTEYLPTACKRQTTPHMSIGSIVLDKPTPEEYNQAIMYRLDLIAKVKKELDNINPPIRARIQTLKINPDGCVTFQLEHDERQDMLMEEEDFDKLLSKVPTCQSRDAEVAERIKFKRRQPGGHYVVTRFQQVRLALGALGSEIKGLYPAGHMVVVNLVEPQVMSTVPPDKLTDLFKQCYDAWAPFKDEWFELSKVVCLCYVERSLNEGSVVLAPTPGKLPRAFPENSQSAQQLLGGIFTATIGGDVLINYKKFNERRSDRGTSTWKAFRGEIRELAENQSGMNFDTEESNAQTAEVELREAFNVFDTDRSGYINSAELKLVMYRLGETVTDEELREMTLKADTDGSGHISFSEFVSMMMGGNNMPREPTGGEIPVAKTPTTVALEMLSGK